MVHTFICLGRRFAVDTESGSFFETDGITYKLIENIISPDKNKAGDFSCFTNDEITGAKQEIADLIRENILFSHAPQNESPPEFNGEIKSLCLNISHKCNLACSYCFADGGGYGSEGGHMPLSTAKAAVDFLIAKSGNRRNLEIDFFGGEPLLNFEVVKACVAYARSLEKKYGKIFLFTLTTNALLLTDAVTEFCNREMDNVVISIDGREKVHNSVRKTVGGGDSFAVALKNAKRFRELRGNRQYYIRGTFTANNLDFASDAAALWGEGFESISLEPVVLPDDHPLAIREEHLPKIYAEYERLAADYLQRREKGGWVHFFHFNLDIYNGPCYEKRIRACGAGCGYAAVTPDGKIYPCHQFAGRAAYCIGDVNTKQYDKAIPLRFSAANHIFQKPACRQCWAKYHCSGGCAANAVSAGGNLGTPHKISCALMKKRIECALSVAAIENE